MKLFGSGGNKNSSGKSGGTGPRRHKDQMPYNNADYGNGYYYGEGDAYPNYDTYNNELSHQIASYQKKKRMRVRIVFSVLLIIFIGAVTAYAVLIRPPQQTDSLNTPYPSIQPPVSTEEPQGPDVTEEPDDDSSLRRSGTYTFVCVGNDDGFGNTDTIMVGMLDTIMHKLNIVSIPRDTLVNVPWSTKKVNTIYGMGAGEDASDEEKAEALIQGMRDIFGYTVDCYISVDLEAFVKLVDTIGGIDFDVPQRMNYTDPDQDLYIDLQAGYQHLDGEKAIQLVRFRSYPDGDLGRIATQQSFLAEVSKKLLSIESITKINEFADIFKEYVVTDLDVGNIAWFGQEFLNLSSEDITFMKVPGDEGPMIEDQTIPGGTFIAKGSYVSTYIDEWVDMINEYMNPYKIDITEANLNIIAHDRTTGTFYSTSGVFAQ